MVEKLYSSGILGMGKSPWISYSRIRIGLIIWKHDMVDGWQTIWNLKTPPRMSSGNIWEYQARLIIFA